MPERIKRSTKANIRAAIADITKTIIVVRRTSLRVGQVIFETSDLTCWINWNGLVVAILISFLISFDIRVITKKYKLVDYTKYFQYSLIA